MFHTGAISRIAARSSLRLQLCCTRSIGSNLSVGKTSVAQNERVYRIMNTSLPQQLVKLRDIRRWSQARCAKEAGISRSCLNKIERGLAPDVRFSTVLNLCRAFELDSLDQLTGMDESYPGPGKCQRCGGDVVRAHHSMADCIWSLHIRRWPNVRIAQKTKFHVEQIKGILEIELRVRRARRCF